MDSFPATEFTGELDLRLATSETVPQMAEMAFANETHEEKGVFYSHLRFHCIRFQSFALSHLGSLIAKTGLQEFPSQISVWKQHHGAKLEFITRWLKLGDSGEHRRELDKTLEKCADDLKKQQQEDSYKKAANTCLSSDIGEPSYVVQKAAKSIFDALMDCKRCSCSSQHVFSAKLELAFKTIRKNKRKSRSDDDDDDDDAAGKLDFDIFLSMEHDWHEVRVQAMKERMVGFAIDGPDGEVVPPRKRGDASASKSVKVEKLCRSIAKTKTKSLQRLVLKLASGQLFDLDFEKSNFWIDKTAEPISLSQCFEERHEFFTEKSKRIISLIIGYAVLHLNGTSWLPPGWGSANVKFFQTTSRKTPLRPFIQTHLPEARPDRDRSDLDEGHGCPELIALAVVLMEVCFAESFEKLATMKGVQLIENPSGRITLVDVCQGFDGDEDTGLEGWRYQIHEDSPLLAAIDNCLDAELWEDDESAALDNGTLTSRIYQHVVRFLEIHLACGFGQIPLDSVDKYARDLDFGRWGQTMASQEPQSCATTFQVGVHLVIPELRNYVHQNLQFHCFISYSRPTLDVDSKLNFEADYRASRFFDDEMSDGEHSTAKYLKWRCEYEKVYDKFIRRHITDPASKRVKIAILDTGIDREHRVLKAREENIRAKLNCYDESQKNIPDLNVHGTFTASLILDYAPDVELYVVEVAGKNSRPDARTVVIAINIAVSNWNVDLISMSFGAFGKKVIIFAAASNGGGRLGRAYPASSSQVICIHSTNTLGTPSDFSPTAEPNDLNFATVGESTSEICQVSVWDVVRHADYGRDRGIPAAVYETASIRKSGIGAQEEGKHGGIAEEMCRARA
ncbi:hypothetical protein V8C37DRAFT_420690 [Trichoderma ceciliae]